MKNNIVAERIRNTRKGKPMTQKELAAAINVSPQVISNWERGYTPEIGHDDLLNLSLTLGVTTDYLLGKIDHPSIMTINSVREQNNDYNEKKQAVCVPSPLQLSDDELALIEKYRKMKDNQKDTMHKVADTIFPNDEEAAAVGK